MNKELSLKIKQLQFILCVFIVIMHSNNLSYDGIDGVNLLNLIEQGLGGGICQVAVPIFYFLSAYLFFWNCYNKESIGDKLKSRIHTLLVPYLIWNTVWEIYYFLLYKACISEKDFSGYTFFNYILDVISSKNTALWFVKWLILFSAAAPIINYILHHRVMFWLTEILSLIILLEVKVNYYTPLYWLPMYLMGGYFGIHKMLVIDKDRRWKKVTVCGCLIVLISLILVALINNNWLSYVVLRYIGSYAFLLIWVLLPLFNFNVNVMNYTFPIYCMHVPICGLIKHFSAGIGGFILSPIISIGIIYLFAQIIIRYMPTGYYILFGKKVINGGGKND